MSRPDWFPNFFWAGPQKSASTWAYRCFSEHPDVFVPGYEENLRGIGGDALQYFTIHYQKGPDWYRQFYEDYDGEPAVGDTTPSYFRSKVAIRRMARDAPGAKIILCLRDPIDRAFSHYWHEKKKGTIQFEFEEVLENYDLFTNWVETGFYAEHLRHLQTHFPEDRILLLLQDDLEADDRAVARRVFSFLEVDPEFEPGVLGKRVNAADYRRNRAYRSYETTVGFLERLDVKGAFEWIRGLPGFERAKDWAFGRDEYVRGVPEAVRSELVEIFEPGVRELEEMIDRDLSSWLD